MTSPTVAPPDIESEPKPKLPVVLPDGTTSSADVLPTATDDTSTNTTDESSTTSTTVVIVVVALVVVALLGAVAAVIAYRAGARRNRDRDPAPAVIDNRAFEPLPPITASSASAAGPVYELPDPRQPAIYDENKRGRAAGPADYDIVERAVGGAVTGTARASGTEHPRGEPVTVQPEGPCSMHDASGRADEYEPTEDLRPAPEPQYATVAPGAAATHAGVESSANGSRGIRRGLRKGSTYTGFEDSPDADA